MPNSPTDSRGFTLLELVMTIAILAIIGGVVINQFSGPKFEAQTGIARHEMEQLRQALVRYYNDNVTRNKDCVNGVDPSGPLPVSNGDRFPLQSSPADIAFLKASPLLSDGVDLDCAIKGMGLFGEPARNVDLQLGFNGPYIKKPLAFVDIGGLGLDGVGSVFSSADAEQGIVAIADSFTQAPVAKDTGAPFCDTDQDGVSNECLLDWRTLGNSQALPQFGRPYLFFDLNQTDARIVSMGADGKFGGNNVTDLCQPNGNSDDLVSCLFR